MAYNPYYNASNNSGKAPVVVQGQVVASPYNNTSSVVQPGDALSSSLAAGGHQGSPQPKRCNDFFWGLLFYAHLGVIAWATATYAPSMMNDMANNYAGGRRNRLLLWSASSFNKRNLQEDNEDVSVDMDGLMILLGIAGVVGFLLSSTALGFMMRFAETLIRVSLIGNIVLYVLLALLSLVAGALPMALVFLLGAGLTAWYAKVVWSRIPFAASNLRAAISGVRANFGLTFYAYLSLFVTFGWTVWWAVAAVASTYVANGCNANGECESDPNGFMIFGLLVSYYWTIQVIKNVVHVTVAGTIGTWWFCPDEASSCCSSAVRDSWVRSMTTSFGSICLGSLIVAIIQATKEMLQRARESDDGILMCCAEFLLGCIESLVEYFNQWAFVFVGLYGYSFIEAGKNVIHLFKERGWTAIIADTLVDTVLFMVSMGVACLTGLVGLIVAGAAGFDMGTAFVTGLVVGFVLCATLFSIVSSAVNTVIVCYAEAPAEFQANHPQLSEDMRATWRQAWPADFQY